MTHVSGKSSWPQAALIVVAALTGFQCARSRIDAAGENATPIQVAPPSGATTRSVALESGVLADVASRALPAVVSVASVRVSKVETPDVPFLDDPFFRRFFGPEREFPFPFPRGGERIQRGLGSGVIVGPDVILTNAHVVEGAKELEITGQNKRSLKAKLVGSDTKSDLAVLRIKGSVSGLTPLAFADSSKLRLGQVVLAIGNPFGIGQTVTMGIVSATSRADLGIEAYEDFIQTDAAINPGNSGGALVDLDGRLVGVPTAILSRSGGSMGVGFAIPSDMAQPIMKSLLEHGRVDRGFIGVTIQNLDSDLASALGLATLDGVLIADVKPGGPAEKAGLRRGDVVLSVEGQSVQTTGQLRNRIAASAIGKPVRIEIQRNKERQTLSVTVERLPDDDAATPPSAAAPSDAEAGLTLRSLDAGLRKKLDAPASLEGVYVVEVGPGSAAARAGLEAGDVIVQAGGKPVTSAGDISRRIRESDGALALLVWREQHTFFAVLKP